MHARRIARQHDAQRLGAGIEAERVSLVLTVPGVEQPGIEPAREAAEHRRHSGQDGGDLHHVAPYQHVGHAGRRRKLADVVVRRLHPVAKRQRVVEEMTRRFGTDVQEPPRRNRRERGAGLLLHVGPQVPPDQAGIRLTDLDEWLPGSIVRNGDDIEAFVRNAVTQQRNMQHHSCASVHALHDGRLEARKGRTLRTPSHGYSRHGGSRSASSRSRNRGMKNSFVSVVSRTRPVWP